MRPSLTVVQTSVFGVIPDRGNPAPIVFDADQLSPDQMLGVAGRLKAETVFILRSPNGDGDVRLRYFVPNHEMEMCVHGTVGAIAALARRGQLRSCPAAVETPLGVVRAEWRALLDGRVHVLLDQFAPTFPADSPAKAEVARVLRIPESLIADEVAPIQAVSTSRAKLFIPLRDWRTLDSLQPDFEALWQLCDRYHVTGLYPFTLDTRDPVCHAEARQFPNRAGFDEDPATGVAACALGAYLSQHGLLSQPGPDEHVWRIGQGRAMGRPSMMDAIIRRSGGTIVRTQVGGTAKILRTVTLD